MRYSRIKRRGNIEAMKQETHLSSKRKHAVRRHSRASPTRHLFGGCKRPTQHTARFFAYRVSNTTRPYMPCLFRYTGPPICYGCSRVVSVARMEAMSGRPFIRLYLSTRRFLALCFLVCNTNLSRKNIAICPYQTSFFVVILVPAPTPRTGRKQPRKAW